MPQAGSIAPDIWRAGVPFRVREPRRTPPLGREVTDYVLAEFIAQSFRDAMADPHLAIWVEESRVGIDGSSP
jgi:hypothetical protein